MLEEMEEPEPSTLDLLLRQLKGELHIPLDVWTDCKQLHVVVAFLARDAQDRYSKAQRLGLHHGYGG